MKVMLLFPPNWTPSMPHLALPSLTAYLRARGVEVIQRDLNAEVFDAILTRDELRASLRRLQARFPHGRAPGPGPAPSRELLAWSAREGPALADRIEAAKRLIRSQDYYDGPRSLPAFETIIGALQLASLPYYPATLHLQGYDSAYPPDSSAAIMAAVRDRRRNQFIELFERLVIPDVLRERPDVVGISIPSVAQVIAGMTLAHLVKQSGAPAHVTIGGPMVSIWREQLPHTPHLFELIDSAIVFDGEEPLYRLVQVVRAGTPLAAVPNLIYRDRAAGATRVTARQPQARLTNLPLPDFDGLPLDRYLAPDLVLPLATTRGCYFGKCAFCNVGYGESEVFSQLRAETLAAQMLALHERYGCRHIFFVDEALTPRTMRALSPRLAMLGAPIRWGGCARFEKTYTGELLQSMAAGGCCMLLFGLEAAAQRIMDRMVKGTHLAIIRRILPESAAAGIWNHTFFFFGFPGETLEEAQETVNFLYEHSASINSAALGTFFLERYAPAHQHPAAYGITRVIERPGADLGFYFDYEVESGLDAATAELVMERFTDALPAKEFPQFYCNDVYRFLYAAHLSRTGAPRPPWLGAPVPA
jgi:radical SAM superfamily enzyme YgiQ (UPF0313 family)